MYALKERLVKLNTQLEQARNDLKSKLNSKQISYPQNATLRQLISLIPLYTITPIDLYASLSAHTSVNISDSAVMFCGGYNNIQKLYDINNNTFTSKRNYPNTIKEHAGAKWGNAIYYCGGYNGSPTNKTYAYNIQSNTFTQKINVPHNIAYHTFVSTNRYLLLSGGNKNVSEDSRSQYTYDVASNSYITRANMLQSSDHISTAHIKNEQVLINGGNDSHNQNLNYIYDMTANSTTQKINLSVARAHHKSLKISDNLILINGGNVSASNTTQIFNVNANTFTNKKTPPRTWFNHTLSKVKNDFLISGGGNNKQYVYSYERDTYVSS